MVYSIRLLFLPDVIQSFSFEGRAYAIRLPA